MSYDSPIRILVADDTALTRLGIVTLIRTQPDMEVVGEAADGGQAVVLFRKLLPDVLLLDLRMPIMDGVQVISNLVGESPAAKILVLSHYDGSEDIFTAVKAGARGYLTKDFRSEEILDAIRTVHAGRRHLPAPIADRMAERMIQSTLSGREQQVLEGIFKGLSNREIADSIEISEGTTKVYVRKILEKLGAKSRTDAVSIALQRGLLRKP